jgi:sugar phosphate isomerase/epimerase
MAETPFSFMWNPPIETALAELIDLGLKDFDVMLSPGHLWPGERDGPARDALKRKLRPSGVRLESLNPPALGYNLGSMDDEVRASSVRPYERALELAPDLDVKGVAVVPRRVSGLFPLPSEQTMPRLEDSSGKAITKSEERENGLQTRTHFIQKTEGSCC